MNIQEIVKIFADSVSSQSAALETGDYRSGNKFAKSYVSAFEKLCTYGESGRDALSVLLRDNRKDVRVMAAAYLLRHCEDQAKAVLEKEAGDEGIISFGAKQVLKRWEDGTWDLDQK